jgi:hypothetical protein
MTKQTPDSAAGQNGVDKRTSGRTGNSGWASSKFYLAAITAAIGGATYLIQHSQVQGRLDDANAQLKTWRDNAGKYEAQVSALMGENAALKSQAADAATCHARLNPYLQNDPILAKIRDIEQRKAHLDSDIIQGAVTDGGNWERADVSQVAYMRIESQNYEDELTGLAKSLQCTTK